MTNSTLSMRKEPPEFGELVRFMWSAKLVILGISFACAIMGVVLALSLPSTYRSTAILASTQSLKSNSGDIGGQLGGLAALAGISATNDNGFKTEVALAKLVSKSFLYKFIDDNDLRVPLLASDSWDPETNTLHLDNEIYDNKSNKFINLEESKQLWEAYIKLTDSLTIDKEKSGLYSISYEHHSPYIAQDILKQLVVELNATMQRYDIDQAKKSIEYLNNKLEQTNVSDMQVVFYRLIEEQTKQKMLTEIEDEYILTTIDPPSFPDEKSGPKRAFIVIICTFLGGLLVSMIYLVQFYIARNK
ncbi:MULTISPECIES: Wzz/FepE/Etk N-terminal domain-containing protein [Pseudoalteromonas]|uniref:Polysaccharide chain length determinant N-terminal domain-containing protein n=1 Tax=Pseudoalteromonas amylolytica TaxID=1859457 RepID=A0A1S1MUV8_9GAMM|nr:MULTISPECIES: Wzz/FepE/Etk N-terminal domain-containing protein [Pseudoalteromonas]OHU90696.1 hypothetical protein BFC16_03580 [Pseudoalteromonas sp. JW3]OHU92685.1 hypothetical protein BET10_04310 [Pseudoalteromonas amylolytica]